MCALVTGVQTCALPIFHEIESPSSSLSPRDTSTPPRAVTMSPSCEISSAVSSTGACRSTGVQGVSAACAGARSAGAAPSTRHAARPSRESFMRWSDVRAAMVGDDPVCSGSPSDRVALHQPGIGRGLQDLAVARAGAETTLAPVAADLDAMPAPTELLAGRGGPSPLADDLAGARSEERRVGKECVSTCKTRGAPDH